MAILLYRRVPTIWKAAWLRRCAPGVKSTESATESERNGVARGESYLRPCRPQRVDASLSAGVRMGLKVLYLLTDPRSDRYSGYKAESRGRLPKFWHFFLKAIE